MNPLNITRFNYIHFNDVGHNLTKIKKMIGGIEKPELFIHSEGIT